MLQVVLDLLQLLDGLVDAGDVAEGGLGWSLATVLCLLRPNCITRPPPPWERFITNSRMPPMSSTGRITVTSVPISALGFCASTSVGTSDFAATP